MERRFLWSHLRGLSNSERQKLLTNVYICDIISAPGHSRLRSEDRVLQMATHFPSDFMDSKIILNLTTNFGTGYLSYNQLVTVGAVDCFDGHHRLVAALIAHRWLTVGDIPASSLDILVNGYQPSGGHKLDRWIPRDVAERSSLPWSPVDSSQALSASAKIDGATHCQDKRFAASDWGVPLGQIANRIAHENALLTDFRSESTVGSLYYRMIHFLTGGWIKSVK